MKRSSAPSTAAPRNIYWEIAEIILMLGYLVFSIGSLISVAVTAIGIRLVDSGVASSTQALKRCANAQAQLRRRGKKQPTSSP